MIEIRPFAWQDWNALWQLRAEQLAEAGIQIDHLPETPDPNSPNESDYHRMAAVYLRGAGNFWLAWAGEEPIGHVGAQTFGESVELRRMYVHPEYRRRGVGTLLVEALIRHCRARGVKAIELWTAQDGPGRRLYEKQGFRVAAQPGQEFGEIQSPPGELRMRLDL